MDILAAYPYALILFVWSRKAYGYFERKKDSRFPAGSSTFFVMQLSSRVNSSLPRMCSKGVFKQGDACLVYYVDILSQTTDEVILPFLEARRVSKRSHTSELLFFHPPDDLRRTFVESPQLHVLMPGDVATRGFTLLVQLLGVEAAEICDVLKEPPIASIAGFLEDDDGGGFL